MFNAYQQKKCKKKLLTDMLLMHNINQPRLQFCTAFALLHDDDDDYHHYTPHDDSEIINCKTEKRKTRLRVKKERQERERKRERVIILSKNQTRHHL